MVTAQAIISTSKAVWLVIAMIVAAIAWLIWLPITPGVSQYNKQQLCNNLLNADVPDGWNIVQKQCDSGSVKITDAIGLVSLEIRFGVGVRGEIIDKVEVDYTPFSTAKWVMTTSPKTQIVSRQEDTRYIRVLEKTDEITIAQPTFYILEKTEFGNYATTLTSTNSNLQIIIQGPWIGSDNVVNSNRIVLEKIVSSIIIN